MRVNNTKIANGPNFVIKNVKKTVIILLTSSNNFLRTEIWSPKWLIDKPVMTAKKTMDKMLPFVAKTEVMLLGIALTRINNGFDPVVPVWVVILSILTLNTPSLFANNPTTPAKIRAKN